MNDTEVMDPVIWEETCLPDGRVISQKRRYTREYTFFTHGHYVDVEILVELIYQHEGLPEFYMAVALNQGDLFSRGWVYVPHLIAQMRVPAVA